MYRIQFKRIMTFIMVAVLLAGVVPTAFATGTAQEEITWTSVDETVYVTANVNVRSGPGVEYSQLGSIAYGQAIRRTAVGSNGWSKVEFNGMEAFMATSYLSATKPGTSGSVGYDDLTRQVAIANGLNAADYTRESWEVVQQALEAGQSALESKKQSEVESA